MANVPQATVFKTVTAIGGNPPTQDGITLFVFNPPTAYTTTGETVFNSLAGVEEAGITEAKDLANDVLVWEHLKDFFARTGDSTEVHVLFVAEACTFTNLFTVANANYVLLRNYLASKEGAICMVGVSLKPASETNTGLSTDVITAIPLAQVVADAEFTAGRPIEIVLEGRKLTGTATSAQDLRALGSGNVSVMVGRDAVRKAELATAGNSGADNYAAIGLLLGEIASVHVGRSAGRVAEGGFNLTPEFSGGQKPKGTGVNDYSEADLNTLNTKGYIFFRKIQRKVPAYLNEDHTCAAVNLSNAYIRYNRVLGKGAKIALDTYNESILDEFPVDNATTGLFPETVKLIETSLREAIEREMLNNPNPTREPEISSVRVTLASTVNILTSRKITAKLSMTPLFAAAEIETEVQLSVG